METFFCDICKRRTPTAFCNKHHIRPEAAGGTDADLVALCAGCHQNLHAVEKILRGKNATQAEDISKAFYYDNLEAARRLLAYAHEAARWLSAKKEGNAEAGAKAHDEEDVLITLPHAVKQYLQGASQHMKHPVTGKKLGLTGFIRHMVMSSAFQQCPPLKDVVAKSQIQAQIKKEETAKAGPKPRRNVLG